MTRYMSRRSHTGRADRVARWLHTAPLLRPVPMNVNECVNEIFEAAAPLLRAVPVNVNLPAREEVQLAAERLMQLSGPL